MRYAYIYRPARTAMQAGKAHTRRWILTWRPNPPQKKEHLMQWDATRDTQNQVSLSFDSREAAVFFAQKSDIPFIVEDDTRQAMSPSPKSYADQFRYKKPSLFTNIGRTKNS